MTPETARKAVALTLLVGGVSIAYASRNQGTATIYRRTWGLLLLTAGGAVLADFAPAAVGPYMVLVLLGLLLSKKSGLGGLLGEAGAAINSNGGR